MTLRQAQAASRRANADYRFALISGAPASERLRLDRAALAATRVVMGMVALSPR